MTSKEYARITSELYSMKNAQNRFELFIGQDISSLLLNKVHSIFPIRDDESVLYIRKFYDNDKAEHFSVITERGMYCDNIHQSPAVRFTDVSQVKRDFSVYRNHRLVFSCSRDNIVPDGTPCEKLIEILNSFATYRPRRDVLSSEISLSFISNFRKFSGYEASDFILYDFNANKDLPEYEHLNQIERFSLSDEESILLYRDSIAIFGPTSKVVIITDFRILIYDVQIDDCVSSYEWTRISSVISMLDTLYFYDENNSLLFDLPLYCIVKRKKKLFEEERLIYSMAETVARSFQNVIKDIRKRSFSLSISPLKYTGPLKSNTSVLSTVCPHCGSPYYEIYYSPEFLGSHKHDEAKHWLKEAAGGILSYALTGKTGPYSSYSAEVPDEYKCSSCGKIFKKK